LGVGFFQFFQWVFFLSDNWLGTDYVIFSHGGGMTGEEFAQFWQALEREMPGSEDY
jgi:hypothetical protein